MKEKSIIKIFLVVLIINLGIAGGLLPAIKNSSQISTKSNSALSQNPKSSTVNYNNITVISDRYQGISWNFNMSSDPDIAVDSSGNLHVVWDDISAGKWKDTANDREIMYASRTANGWSNITVISDDVTHWNYDYSNNPQIHVDFWDNIHVVWEEDTPGVWGPGYDYPDPNKKDNEIMYVNRTSAGWSNVTAISDGYGGVWGWNNDTSASPSITVDRLGNVHVVWQDDTDGIWGTDYEIMYVNRTATNVWSNVTVISDDGTLWNDDKSNHAEIAVDSSNNLYVVWQDDTNGTWGTDREIMYVNRTVDNVWSNITVLSPYNGDSMDPVIVVDKSDNLHVAWEDRNGWVDIEALMYSKYSVNSGWSNDTVTYSDNVDKINIAVDSSGNVHLVWEDDTPGVWGTGSDYDDEEIMYTKYSPSSGISSIPIVISDGYGGIWGWNTNDSSDPAMAMDKWGNIHVVWEEDTPGVWGIGYDSENEDIFPDQEIFYTKVYTTADVCAYIIEDDDDDDDDDPQILILTLLFAGGLAVGVVSTIIINIIISKRKR